MPLARAPIAETLLVMTEAMIPNPIVKTPAIHAMLGTRIMRPASLHVPIQVAGDVAQIAELGEPLLHEDNVGRVGRDRRSAPQRDRHVRLLESDRVVDSIAHEADFPAFLLQLLHIIGLVGRQDLGEVAIHSQRLGQFAGGGLVVARDDGEVLDSALSEALDDVSDLGTNRRVQLDGTADHVIHPHHHHRMPFAVSLFQGVLDFLAHRQAFELHEPLAANPDHASVDAGP